MAHTGWLRLLAKNGYEISLVDLPGKYDRDNMLVKVSKDGAVVDQLDLRFMPHGHIEPTEVVYRELCYRLKLATRRGYCPEGPVELEVKTSGEGHNEKIETMHPSFGLIRMNKYSGGSKHFMSPIDTGGGITFGVHSARLVQDTSLGTENVFQDKQIFEAHMSFTQFAELITGGGTQIPCTLKYVNGIDIDPFPEMETPQERLTNVLRNRLTGAVTEIKQMVDEIDAEMSGAGALTAKRKKEIWEKLKYALRDIHEKPSWFMRMWSEGANEILKHAKGEFIAWVSNGIKTPGSALEQINTSALEAPKDKDAS